MKYEAATIGEPGDGYVLAQPPLRVSVKSVDILPGEMPIPVSETAHPGVRFLLSWPKGEGWGAAEHSLRLSKFLWLVYGKEWREVVARALQEPDPPED